MKFDGEICGGVLVENASDDFPQQKKLENHLPNFAGSLPPISPKTSPTSLWKSLVLNDDDDDDDEEGEDDEDLRELGSYIILGTPRSPDKLQAPGTRPTIKPLKEARLSKTPLIATVPLAAFIVGARLAQSS